MVIDRALGERALWVLCQIPELHEISYHLGRLGDGVPLDTQCREFRRGQVIMAEATGVAVELERALAPPEPSLVLLKGEAPVWPARTAT